MRVVMALAVAATLSACGNSNGVDHDALKSISDIPEGPGLLTGDSGTFERTL